MLICLLVHTVISIVLVLVFT